MAKKKSKIENIRASLKAAPENAELILKLVAAYKECGDFKNAIKILNKNSVILNKPIMDIELAEICVAQGDSKQAIILYQSCLEILKLDVHADIKLLATVYNKLADLSVNKDTLDALYYYWNSYSLVEDESVFSKLNLLSILLIKTVENNEFLLIKNEAHKIHVFINMTKADKFTYCIDNLSGSELLEEYEKNLKIPSLGIIDIKLMLQILEENQAVLLNTAIAEKWVDLYCRFLSASQWKINFYFFKLPIFLKKINYEISSSQSDALNNIKNNLLIYTDSPTHKLAYYIVIFLIDCLIVGIEKAIDQLIKHFYELAAQDPTVLQFFMLLLLSLYKEGYFEDNEALIIDILTFIANKINGFKLKSNYGLFYIIYSISTPRSWNKLIFEKVVIPTTISALERNDFLYADRVIACTDLSYAQQPMTEQHNKACRDQYLPFLLKKGRELGKVFAIDSTEITVQKQITLGFVVNLMFNMCSPIVVLFNILKSLKKYSNYKFVVYAFYGKLTQDVLMLFKQNIDIDIVDLSEVRGQNFEFDNYLDRLRTLKSLMKAQEVDIVFFIQSTYFFMALAATVRLAPKQVFLEMTGGNSTFRIPEIEEYMCGGAVGEYKKIVNGYEWRCFQGKVSESLSPDPNIKARAMALRANKFAQFEVLLGTIGRPQKIDNDEFIQMLSLVLKPNPQAAFLWFGNEELSSVKNKMRQYGIEKQCFFQGWVDSKLYANVIDIHLDSFPFPCGLTNRETMAAGCPNVFMYNEDTYNISMLQNILPILEKKAGTEEQQTKVADIFTSVESNKCLLLFSENIEDYAKNVNELIKNEAFRYKIGSAGKSFVDNYLESGSYLADIFVKHINEIIEK